MKKRVFAMLLAAVLLAGLMPTAVFAQTPDAAQYVTQDAAQEPDGTVLPEAWEEAAAPRANDLVLSSAAARVDGTLISVQSAAETQIEKGQAAETSETGTRRTALGVVLLVAGVALLLYAFFMRGKKS